MEDDLTTEQQIQIQIHQYEDEIDDLKNVIWECKKEIKEFEQLLIKLRKNKNGKATTN